MEKLTDKPRTLLELSDAYSVDKKTFKGWLKCPQLLDIEAEKLGNFFSINQVKRIVAHLGEP
jgi:hypothetical protein